MRNLGEAVQALGNRHAAAARRAVQHVRSHLAAVPVPVITSTEAFSPVPTATQLASVASRENRQARYEGAARLYDIGATITRISAELGADRKKARKCVRRQGKPIHALPHVHCYRPRSLPQVVCYRVTRVQEATDGTVDQHGGTH